MTIPDYQSIMLPLLQLAADGKEHSISSATDALRTHFNLTPEEASELLPSVKAVGIFQSDSLGDPCSKSSVAVLKANEVLTLIGKGEAVVKSIADSIP